MLEVEVNGSLSSYQFGQNLCLDSNVRLGRGQGRLEIGHNVGLGCATAPKFGDGGLLLEPRSPQAIISIGSSTNISNNVSIIAVQSVCIGEFCRIGDAVEIFDSDFHEIDPIKRDAGPGRICPVAIGNNVWLGSRVLILRGVNIGDNSVIGAGSVVTNSIPADSVAAGVPARFIRHV